MIKSVNLKKSLINLRTLINFLINSTLILCDDAFFNPMILTTTSMITTVIRLFLPPSQCSSVAPKITRSLQRKYNYAFKEGQNFILDTSQVLPSCRILPHRKNGKFKSNTKIHSLHSFIGSLEPCTHPTCYSSSSSNNAKCVFRGVCPFS